MLWLSADFSGWFRLNGKLRKSIDIIVSTKSVFFNSDFGGGGCSPRAWLRSWLCTCWIGDWVDFWVCIVMANRVLPIPWTELCGRPAASQFCDWATPVQENKYVSVRRGGGQFYIWERHKYARVLCMKKLRASILLWHDAGSDCVFWRRHGSTSTYPVTKSNIGEGRWPQSHLCESLNICSLRADWSPACLLAVCPNSSVFPLAIQKFKD